MTLSLIACEGLRGVKGSPATGSGSTPVQPRAKAQGATSTEMAPCVEATVASRSMRTHDEASTLFSVAHTESESQSVL